MRYNRANSGRVDSIKQNKSIKGTNIIDSAILESSKSKHLDEKNGKEIESSDKKKTY